MNFFDKEISDILLKFLDKRAKEAEEEIKKNGVLSEDKAIPLILKSQFNHIIHLDNEITTIRSIIDEKISDLRSEITERFGKIDEKFEKIDEKFEKIDERFEKIDKRFEKIDERFNRVYVFLGIGFTVIAALVTIFGFIR